MVLEWNEVVLYPAGTPADKLMYEAKLILPEGWKFGTSLPVATQSGNEVTFKPISLDLLVDSPVTAGQYYRSDRHHAAGRTDSSRDRHGGRQRRRAEHERERPEGDDEPGCGVGQAVRRAALSRLPFPARAQRSRGALRAGASRVERQPLAGARYCSGRARAWRWADCWRTNLCIRGMGSFAARRT